MRLSFSRTQGVVYELIDPRDGKCRYVGQTFAPDKRKMEHLKRPPSYQHNNKLYFWKEELMVLGISPQFRVIEDGIPAEDINDRERFWCRNRSDQGCELLNRPAGYIRKDDLLGSPRRQAIAQNAREVNAMLCAIYDEVRGKLPFGKGPLKRLSACIQELQWFAVEIDD